MHTENHSPSAAEELPENALARAKQYLWLGDLNALINLPLRPHEMMEAAEVLLGAPPSHRPAAADWPAPTLSHVLRHRLRVLAEEAGAQADAALLILTADFRARTKNQPHDALHLHHRAAHHLTSLRAV